jgi:tRNA A37 methylthiotransferase MiaB
MKKMHTAKLSLKILKLLNKAQIDTTLFVMVGFPTETEKDIRKTFSFLKKYQHLYKKTYLCYFQLLKETSAYNHPENFNLTIKKIDNKICVENNQKLPIKIIKKMIKEFRLEGKIIMYDKKPTKNNLEIL